MTTKYTAKNALAYNSCWTKLFSNSTTCGAVKTCNDNNACKNALYEDYSCSIACN